MSDLSKRRTGEPFDDYFVRLFEDKDRYGLTCQDIAELLNAEVGVNFGESKWRKEYAAFARGMRYAREKTMRGIKNRILCISDTHVPYELPVETFADYVGVTDLKQRQDLYYKSMRRKQIVGVYRNVHEKQPIELLETHKVHTPKRSDEISASATVTKVEKKM